MFINIIFLLNFLKFDKIFYNKRFFFFVMHCHKKVGDFFIEKLIGIGAFSEVYLAIHTKCEQKVAVKVINLDTVEPDDEICVTREIAIHLQLDHPNIVYVYHYILQPPFLYLFMELINGGTVLDMINGRRKFTEEKSRIYFLDILSSLYYLHRGRFVAHRDIKPQNIMISNDGTAKLIDFGFSNVINSKKFSSFVGTPGFTPPEIIIHNDYNESCDIFSLGVCLFSLVTGNLPFELQNKNSDLLISQIENLDYPDFISNNLKELLKLMLNHNPNNRANLDNILDSKWINEIPIKKEKFNVFQNPVDIRPFPTIDSLTLAHRKPSFEVKKNIIEMILKFGYDKKKTTDEVKRGIISSDSACYYIIHKLNLCPEETILPLVHKKVASSSRNFNSSQFNAKTMPRPKKPKIFHNISQIDTSLKTEIKITQNNTTIPLKKNRQKP